MLAYLAFQQGYGGSTPLPAIRKKKMYQALNTLFFGIPKQEVRRMTGRIIQESNYEAYVIPCTGRFALADTFVGAGIKSGQIVTGDISLFSSLIGYYLSNKDISDLGVTIQGEKITPDINGVAETLYHLKLGSIKPSNYYLTEVMVDLKRYKERHVEKLINDLEALKERLNGIQFEIKDMRVMIDEWKDRDAFIFLDPPVFSSRDYVNMFDTEIIQWREPNIPQFEPKTDFAPMMADLRQTKATVVTYLREKNKEDEIVKDWYSFFAHQNRKAEVEYLYVNKDLSLIQAKRPSADKPQRAPYPILTDKDEITEDSEISVVHITHEQAMYYRDLFVHRLGVSQAEVCVLLLIDKKIFSVRGLMYFRGGNGPDFTVTEIFGLVAPNRKYRHLGRLAMRIITSKEFLQAITPKNEMFPKRYITSTTISKYPKAREDKGILEIYDSSILKNGLYRLRYKTSFTEKSYIDCLLEWLNEERNYGTQKRKKKRVRPRQWDGHKASACG